MNKKRNTRILSENEISESEAISKLNGIRKHYVKEGVYTFNYYVNQSFNEIDKFGNEITGTRYLYTNNYKVSFIGEKIIVLNKRKGIAEEIHLSKAPTISELSEWRVVYDFKIPNWSVRNIKSGIILSPGKTNCHQPV